MNNDRIYLKILDKLNIFIVFKLNEKNLLYNEIHISINNL